MSKELLRLHFHCKACGHRFESEPGRVVDVPDREWQACDYFAPCPECRAEAGQAAWEINLAHAHSRATGPRTPEGKQAAAARLVGHPTPEEAKRTRFNAMKTGMFARTAQYWPARPGAYPHCDSCEHFNRGCDVAPRNGHKNPPACLKRIDLMMQFQIAFETGDPSMLRDQQATLQALVWQMTNDMILSVIKDGVSWKTPEWSLNKDGNVVLAQYIDQETGDVRTIQKIEAHPLLKLIIDYMNRNGMSLPDSGMTMKVRDEQETVRGFLEGQGEAAESSLAFQERQTKAFEGLQALVERSQKRQARDPVLIEHNALEKADDGE